jgi:hypothetical protein
MELYTELQLTRNTLDGVIKRSSDEAIKEASMKNLYFSIKNYILNETATIHSKIIEEMAKPKKERKNKVIFYANNAYDTKDYIKIFETCFDELDDPLIDLLRQKFPFPYYKVYRKILYEFDPRIDDVKPMYAIFIKWNKKKLPTM